MATESPDKQQPPADGLRELPSDPTWTRMATPPPATWLLDDPVPHPAGARTAKDGRGDVDGPDAVHDFYAPVFWRFLGVHDDDLSTTPGYRRVKAGSPIMSSESQIDAMLDYGISYAERCAKGMDGSGSEPDRLFRGEEEHARKLTVSKGYGPGYQASPPSPPALELPGWYTDNLKRIISLYLHDGDTRINDIPAPQVVIDTSAGWPVFNAGIGPKVISASFFEPGMSFDRMRSLAADWAANNGIDPISTFFNGYGTRTGTNTKVSPAYVAGGNGFMEYARMQSRFCRRRQIYMACIPTFLLLRDFTRIAKATRKTVIPGAWHTGDDDALLITATEAVPGVWIEADISGYDTTISRSHHRALLAATTDARPDLLQGIRSYFEIDDLGTIFPHPTGVGKDNKHARAVTRSGLLSSGILPTAEMGNLYHLPIILELARRCGFRDPIMSLLRREFVILIQGDDLLLKMKGLTPDIMKETYSEAGFTVKAVVANRFLMRHRFGGRWYPVGSRILQTTAFGEHEPTGPHALPLAILGLWARWAHGPHPQVADMVRQGIALTDLAKEGVVDGVTAGRWLRTAKGSRLLEAALKSAASDAWAARLRRDAEFSLSAASILDVATRMGLVDGGLALTAVGNKAINMLISLPRQRREAVRAAMWTALTGGLTGPGLDALALELLGVPQPGTSHIKTT